MKKVDTPLPVMTPASGGANGQVAGSTRRVTGNVEVTTISAAAGIATAAITNRASTQMLFIRVSSFSYTSDFCEIDRGKPSMLNKWLSSPHLIKRNWSAKT